MLSIFKKEVTCMCKHFKVLFLCLILLLTICTPCMAKILRSDDGWIHLTTSDYWHYSSYGGDAANVRLLSIELNNDTRIIVTRGKDKEDYRTYRECNFAADMPEFVAELRCHQLRDKGFNNPKILRSDFLGNGYTFVIHAYKDGIRHTMFETGVAKNYYSYTFQMLANEYNDYEAASVFSTMTIDGLPFSRWLQTF